MRDRKQIRDCDWTNLDESRSNLELSIAGAGTEEGDASPVLLPPPDHHEPVRSLPDQDVIKGPAVHTILGRQN